MRWTETQFKSSKLFSAIKIFAYIQFGWRFAFNGLIGFQIFSSLWTINSLNFNKLSDEFDINSGSIIFVGWIVSTNTHKYV